MSLRALQFGCQTYEWDMPGAAWTGRPGDLVAAIAGGCSARRRDDAGLARVSCTFGSDDGSTERERMSADLDAARRRVGFAAHSPGATVSLGSATMMSDGARADGRVVVEEGSEDPVADPADAVQRDRRTLRHLAI